MYCSRERCDRPPAFGNEHRKRRRIVEAGHEPAFEDRLIVGGLDRRLERLEARADSELPMLWSPHQWPLDEQLEDVRGYLGFHRRFKTTAVCTDREINLLGLAAAYEALGGEAGEWEAPSGGVVSLEDNGDGTFGVHLSSNLAVEDLPEGMREYVERMDPARQAERDGWLYDYHRRGRGDT